MDDTNVNLDDMQRVFWEVIHRQDSPIHAKQTTFVYIYIYIYGVYEAHHVHVAVEVPLECAK